MVTIAKTYLLNAKMYDLIARRSEWASFKLDWP